MCAGSPIKEVEYPNHRQPHRPIYTKCSSKGWNGSLPGHEHTDVAVIAGQNIRADTANADKMAEYEFRFAAADTDAIGLAGW